MQTTKKTTPHRPALRHKVAAPQKRPSSDGVRFIGLGGLEEIGRNMSVFEYKNEILLIDMGLQFPEENTPGIDYIIPNVEGLMSKRHNIRGIIITHGHYDHIGGIPHLLDKLGASIPIYTTDLTKEIIKKRQEDYPHAPKPIIHTIKHGDSIPISEHIKVFFYEIEHTIPDSVGLVIQTPVGNFAYCTDLKIDFDAKGNPKEGTDSFEKMHKHGIHTLFLDSTAAERPGHSLSEEIVRENIETLLKNAKGRIIVGMFASLLSRAGEIVKIAEKLNKKVVLSGFSLKTNFQIAQNLGYIKVKKGTIIPIEEVRKYKDDQLLILSTGAQGEPRASLTKIANGENRHLSVKKEDTIIFSSSIVPGNEMAIQTLKDNLTRQGAKVIQTQDIDVHSGGHGPSEDLKLMIKMVKPKFFLPIHGMYYMRAANCRNAQEVGVPEQNCILADNGQIVDILPDKVIVTNQSVPANYVMVDGLGVGDVEEVVLRDRQTLASEGMLVVISTLDRRSGKFLKNPDIISRGFINLKLNKEFVEEIRKRIKVIVNRIPRAQSIEPDYLKALIRDQLGQFLYSKTKRRPMVLPVIIEV